MNLFLFRKIRRLCVDVLRACLHGGGVPQAGEVTRIGGVSLQSIYSLTLMTFTFYTFTLPPLIWGPPHPCKQALIFSKAIEPIQMMFSPP